MALVGQVLGSDLVKAKEVRKVWLKVGSLSYWNISIMYSCLPWLPIFVRVRNIILDMHIRKFNG